MMKQKKRLFRIAALLVALAITLGVLGFTILEGVVLAHHKGNLDTPPQLMIILGALVTPDGPSILLKDRLDTALDYLSSYPDTTVVVTGGQGDNEPATEASVMAQYLIDAGIDPAQIILEDTSRNTAQNIKNAVALLAVNGIDIRQEVLIVSNGFHLARATLLGERFGLSVSTLAAPTSHDGARVQNYLREPFALVKSFLFDWK